MMKGLRRGVDGEIGDRESGDVGEMSIDDYFKDASSLVDSGAHAFVDLHLLQGQRQKEARGEEKH